MANTEKLGTKQEIEGQENEKKLVAFFKNNEKIIYGVLLGILVVVILIIALFRFIITPRNQKAAEAIMAPIEQFTLALGTGDSLAFAAALDGNEETDGFLTIIDDYGSTKAGNTARYYAAVCYLQQRDPEEALDMLLKYKKNDDNVWYKAQLLIGDLYDEQGDVENAKKYYKHAMKGNTELVAPEAAFKLGMLYEREENWSEAYNNYQFIQDKFYERYNQMGVSKYLERAKIKAGK
ncbi:MAG: tetratricopeptide repeat protein [Bacteroidales bacterium]|nr:tetratricopeptide repeat protein [Bacteroidales bacterium]